MDVHDVLTRESTIVGRIAHRIEDLGRDHQVLAPRLELAQQLAGEDLALAKRVDVSGVEEVDAGLDGTLHQRAGLVLLQHPFAPLLRAVGHHAETERRDADAGLAEPHIIHLHFTSGDWTRQGTAEFRAGERISTKEAAAVAASPPLGLRTQMVGAQGSRKSIQALPRLCSV